MDASFTGRTALVGGGSKGIGRAVAAHLASAGADVVIASRRPPEPGTPDVGSCRHVEADLGTAAGCLRAARDAERLLARVDLLFLNAGGPPSGETLSFDDDAWTAAFETSFLSAVRLCRLLVPAMAARGFGRVVALTSVSAIEPIDRLVLSNAIRPAVHGFLKTLSREVAANGVTVNVVAPGYTATERLRELLPADRLASLAASLPLGRLVDPSETAALVAFLMSDSASAVTGCVLPCDGGALRRA